MNAVVESRRASGAEEKMSDVFHGKIAMRIGASTSLAARKKMSAVSHGKISPFSSAVDARFPKEPNQSLEPTRLIGPRFSMGRVRSTVRCSSKKATYALARVAHL